MANTSKKSRKGKIAKTAPPVAVVAPIAATCRDVSRIPAEIARRVNTMFAMRGRETILDWHYDADWKAALIRYAEGKAEASWSEWHRWQEVERHLFCIATGGQKTARPRVQDRDGRWIKAPLTRAERLAMPPKARATVAPTRVAPRFDGNVVTFPEHRRVRPARGRHGGGGRAA